MLDLRTTSHLLHDPRRELDAPLQSSGGRGAGEPIGEEARAQGITGPRRVHHPHRNRRHPHPFTVRTRVQGSSRAELKDDAGVVAKQLLRDAAGPSAPPSRAPSSKFGKQRSTPHVHFRKRSGPISPSNATDERSTEVLIPASYASRRALRVVSLRLPPERV